MPTIHPLKVLSRATLTGGIVIICGHEGCGFEFRTIGTRALPNVTKLGDLHQTYITDRYFTVKGN